MDPNLKQRLLGNTFVDHARALTFHERAYVELVTTLRQLAIELAGQTLVDKQVAADLYVTPQIVRYAYMKVSSRDPCCALATAFEDAWIELDALVLECLHD